MPFVLVYYFLKPFNYVLFFNIFTHIANTMYGITRLYFFLTAPTITNRKNTNNANYKQALD